MINYFNIFKINMNMRKKFYIGLINKEDGYNIINKKKLAVAIIGLIMK